MHNAMFLYFIVGGNISSILGVGEHGVRTVVAILMAAVIGFITLQAFFGFGAQLETALPAPAANTTLGTAWASVASGFNSLFQITPTLLIIAIFIAVVAFLAIAGRVGWSWF